MKAPKQEAIDLPRDTSSDIELAAKLGEFDEEKEKRRLRRSGNQDCLEKSQDSSDVSRRDILRGGDPIQLRQCLFICFKAAIVQWTLPLTNHAL
ncbi:hypothetical protein Fmac_021182 [Flemingia macrophylla]|uniref:Uncharacterized protein n=1 Tax=Flemingia macrophylla TaxID=520843 RepID=A0ABD1LXU5_9FABA